MESARTYTYWRTDKAKEPGYSHELISTDTKYIVERGATLENLECVPENGCTTMLQNFRRQIERIPNSNFMGTRVGDSYEWMTWREVGEMAENLSYGFMHFDLAPIISAEGKDWRFIGLQSKNRKEWYIASLANMHQNICSVSLYDTLGVDATKYILDQTELTTMVVANEYLSKLADLKIADAKSDEPMVFRLKNLVAMDSNITPEQKAKCDEAGITIYTIEQLVNVGREQAKQGKTSLAEPTPDDSFMIMYTSGTTGDPKGVKMTHRMNVQCVNGLQIRLMSSGCGQFTENDCYISYLPAAHSFEQGAFGCSLACGMKVGFFGGNVLKLTEDMQILKPTFFPSVPRLFNRIYGKIQDKFKEAGGVKGMLVNQALNSKQYYYKNGQGFTHRLWDTLVFGKVKDMLGGNVRIMITGSAPIAGEVLDFLKVCFCCDIIEGYGMTETSAGSFTTHYGDPDTGHVGGPVANVKVRLRDIPEMNYLHTNDPPKGEICMKGSSIMPGYFKNEEKTKETMTDDGWLFSGDVGMVMPNGAVKVIDRAKNIFKLSQGEYIAPEKLENIFVQSPYVMQAWIYGDSLRDHIIGFFVVDPENTKKYCTSKGQTLD